MKWLETLTDLVNDFWATKKQVYQLSKAMGDLNRKGVAFTGKYPGQKIKDAILEDGVTSLLLVRKPNHPLVWGLLPAGVTDVDDIAIWSISRDRSESPSIQTPRYDKAIWTAFIKKIEHGRRRFVFLDSPLRFLDTDVFLAPPVAGIELQSSFVIGPVDGELSEETKEEVERNIKSWCEVNKIDPVRVLAPAIRHESNFGKVHNFFDFADFGGLSSSEKSRILIPLDLLSKVKFGR